MPHLIDASSRTADLVRAMNTVLAREGLCGMTMRAVGRESGVSTASMTHHYGSWGHLVGVAAQWTGRWRLQGIQRRSRLEGVVAFVPVDDELIEARAWLGWCELGRSDDRVAISIAAARSDERAELARTLDYRLDRPGLELLEATIEGLLVARTLPVRPMGSREAQMALLRQTTWLLSEAT